MFLVQAAERNVLMRWHEMDEATMENLKDTASRSKKKRARREYNEKHRGVSEPRFLPFPEAHAYA